MTKSLEKFFNVKKHVRGLPQVYNNVNFYPITLDNIEYYDKLYSILAYPKNTITDKTILKMSYLKFISFVLYGDFREELENLFKHLCRTDNVSIVYTIKNVSTMDIDLFILIDEIKFTEHEFELIRELVLEQNGISLDYINQYDQSLEEKLKIHNNMNKGGETTFEDKIFAFCSFMKILPTDERLWNMSVFQFENQMTRIAVFLNYELFEPLVVSGQIEFKDKSEKILNWQEKLSKKKRYSEILINKKDFLAKSEALGALKTKN